MDLTIIQLCQSQVHSMDLVAFVWIYSMDFGYLELYQYQNVREGGRGIG